MFPLTTGSDALTSGWLGLVTSADAVHSGTVPRPAFPCKWKDPRHLKTYDAVYTREGCVCALQKDVFLLSLKGVRRDRHLWNADNVPSFAHLIFPSRPPREPR